MIRTDATIHETTARAAENYRLAQIALNAVTEAGQPAEVVAHVEKLRDKMKAEYEAHVEARNN